MSATDMPRPLVGFEPIPTPLDAPPAGSPDDQDDLPSGRELVRSLDASLPLVLFPVRLATRFHRPEGSRRPTELWVRIFPDLMAVDSHHPDLTAEEITLGAAYWERIWRAADDPAARGDAHAWLVAQVDAPRAAWVAEATAPLNPKDAPAQPVPAPQPLTPPPEPPELTPRTTSRPAVARLLPDRWCVTLRESVEFVERICSRPVRRDLAIAPNLAELPEDGDVRDLLRAQDLWWMVDFPAAVQAGMALRIALPAGPMRHHIDRLTVFGVRDDDRGSSDELAALLEAHRVSTGLAFVAQGTPTNNTDAVEAGWSPVPADLDAHFARALESRPASDDRPPTRAPGVAGGTHAQAVAQTLGLDDPGPLARVELADRHHLDWARTMNRVVFPATLGHTITRMLATDGEPALDDDELGLVRNWFETWVLGRGLLPTLAVGSQPYGLLPVAERPTDPDDLGDDSADRLLAGLLELHLFGASAQTTPSFSTGQVSAADLTPEEEALRLGGVLGAVPHPLGFRLRDAADARDDLGSTWTDAIDLLEDELLTDVGSQIGDWEYYDVGRDQQLRTGTLDDQIGALIGMWSGIKLYMDQPGNEAAEETLLRHVEDVMLPQLHAHELRSEAAAAWPDRFSGATLPDDGDPDLWYIEYGDDGSAPDGTYPTLELVGNDVAGIVDRLRALADSARSGGHLPGGGQPAGGGWPTGGGRPNVGGVEPTVPVPGPLFPPFVPAPLLLKLAEQAVNREQHGEGEALATALESLADLLEQTDADPDRDATAEAELALRETLGLVGYRYDAWLTSFANERLATLRSKEPTGVQVGGFGWVVDLVPDEGRNDSHGHIHAPSLDHAATAAILRSAWLAHATDVTDAPFAVDLSSDRVRRGTWLLDGVRNGVDLAELLGSRLERRLHDRGLPDLIHDVRVAVAGAADADAGAAERIVDGLAIAVAYSPSTTDDPVRAALDDLRSTLPNHPDDALLGVLENTVVDLDATADLLTAQAVHSATRGSLSQAASVLSSAGAGASAVPPVTLADVHREATLVEHRVLTVLAGDGGDAARADRRLASVAEPVLGTWLAARLPEPATIDVAVVFPSVDRRWSGTLADLGLSAQELVVLSGTGGDLRHSPLRRLVLAHARHATQVAGDVAPRLDLDASAGLEDVVIAAGALRTAIGAARPLRAEDLATTSTVLSTNTDPDADELDVRRQAVVDHLVTLAAGDGDDAWLLAHLADLALVDLAACLAALEADADVRATRLAELVGSVKNAAEAVAAPMREGHDALDDRRRAAQLAERLERVVGVRVLPTFRPGDTSALITALLRGPQTGGPTGVMSWLLGAGRVHEGVGRCADALDLAEAVHPAGAVPFEVAQLPHVDGAPWAAVDRPADATRLTVCAVGDAASALAAKRLSGLLYDAWSESVPRRTIETGVAVHFDQPGAKPPQVVLTVVPPRDGQWTVQGLGDVLDQTLDLSWQRAIGPESLRAYGHSLPATYLAPGTAVTQVTVTDEPGRMTP